MEEQTDLFGIPVPSTDRVFLAIVVIHIGISLVAVVSGLLAMFADKTSPRHYRNGRIYFWSILLSSGTILILSFMRWPHNNHLLIIGVLTFAFTFLGWRLARVKSRGWARTHTMCMGMSYVLLMKGFYVDNGK